jgi:hypothetical protein
MWPNSPLWIVCIASVSKFRTDSEEAARRSSQKIIEEIEVMKFLGHQNKFMGKKRGLFFADAARKCCRETPWTARILRWAPVKRWIHRSLGVTRSHSELPMEHIWL